MIHNLRLVFQSSNAIVVDKPAQWLSIPGRDPKDDRPILSKVLESQLQTKIFPIHRLDAEVSGLILFGLNAEFHREANLLFEKRKVKKTYQAFSSASSLSAGEKMTWKARLLRGKKRTYESPHGKDSVTEASIVQKTKTLCEWRLNPVTGRSHQLRFELSRHGSPILGDTLYGSESPWSKPGIALRAVQIDIPEEFASHWSLPQTLEAELFPPPTTMD